MLKKFVQVDKKKHARVTCFHAQVFCFPSFLYQKNAALFCASLYRYKNCHDLKTCAHFLYKFIVAYKFLEHVSGVLVQIAVCLLTG